jgi:hypothetical protein
VAHLHSASPLLGYKLTGPDNDAYFFGDDVPASVFCPRCHSVVDPTYFPPKIALGKKRDVSVTYDNRVLVSQRFAEFCLSNWPDGLLLTPIHGRGRDYFVLGSNRVVKFDAVGRQTRFEKHCSTCSQYRDVLGAKPVFLVNQAKPLNDGFHRTDIEFGSAEGKAPLILLGVETGRRLEQQSFTGMDLAQVTRIADS